VLLASVASWQHILGASRRWTSRLSVFCEGHATKRRDGLVVSWSNGKAEGLNKTLKYQCFPVIAGNISDWQQAVDLVATWADHYNATRAHGGHINRGLPPLAFLELYNRTPGSHVAKLIELGLIKLDDEWTIRMMGDTRSMFGKQTKGSPDLPLNTDGDGQPLPFALVLDRTPRPGFSQDWSDKGHKLARPPDGEGSGLVLYK
jgi:hypothetical protein